MNWYIDALKKYGVFAGRSRRKAFWMFVLFDAIFTVVASILDGGEGGVFSSLYSLATLVPYVAVSVRRMHDTGHCGWWIIVPIVNLVFLCSDSQPGENKYGPNPKTT